MNINATLIIIRCITNLHYGNYSRREYCNYKYIMNMEKAAFSTFEILQIGMIVDRLSPFLILGCTRLRTSRRLSRRSSLKVGRELTRGKSFLRARNLMWTQDQHPLSSKMSRDVCQRVALEEELGEKGARAHKVCTRVASSRQRALRVIATESRGLRCFRRLN